MHLCARALLAPSVLVVMAAFGCDSPKKDSGNEPPVTANTMAAPSAAPVAVPSSKPGDLPAPPDVAAAPADAQKTASGLASKVLTPGTGKDHPGPTDKVKVHYTGWTKAGKMFDSSVTRGEPISFAL